MYYYGKFVLGAGYGVQCPSKICLRLPQGLDITGPEEYPWKRSRVSVSLNARRKSRCTASAARRTGGGAREHFAAGSRPPPTPTAISVMWQWQKSCRALAARAGRNARRGARRRGPPGSRLRGSTRSADGRVRARGPPRPPARTRSSAASSTGRSKAGGTADRRPAPAMRSSLSLDGARGVARADARGRARGGRRADRGARGGVRRRAAGGRRADRRRDEERARRRLHACPQDAAQLLRRVESRRGARPRRPISALWSATRSRTTAATSRRAAGPNERPPTSARTATTPRPPSTARRGRRADRTDDVVGRRPQGRRAHRRALLGWGCN